MSSKKPLILLVEDEPSLVNLYQVVLGQDYQMEVVNNYEAAENFLLKNKPDLILLDVIIPAGNDSNLDYSQKVGFNLLKKVDDIPVVILTNLDSTKDRETAKELGAYDYVVKANILPKELSRKISKILNENQ